MITQYFPPAVGHLTEAGRASNELVAAWNGLLDAGLFDTGVITDSDEGGSGAGTIVAYADFPSGAREQLTAVFRRYVDELWACLDALVTESVAIFTIHHRLRSPSSPRFFPVADSEEGFGALLEQACLDGVLEPQFSLIRASQPFRREPEDLHLDELRAGLRYLVGWSNGLDQGSLVGAWATAVDPEIYVEPPSSAVFVHPSPPGELVDERVVARYAIDGMPPGATLSGRAGTYIDVAFPDGFLPAGPEDTLNERLRRTTHAVRTFAVAFANIVKGTPGSKRLPHSASTTPDTTWIEAHRSLRRWSADELQAVADSELGLAVVRDAEALTLIIATPQGTFERIIPDASPLPQRAPRGTAAE
ncbi:hypothetical protein [Actinoplanes sp. NPDC026623]|uniref:hypothetical protein n=1 Tax=Actinoplanes sp. NPDC026623 TaxID=3155610 RepID=UPI0033D592A4